MNNLRFTGYMAVGLAKLSCRKSPSTERYFGSNIAFVDISESLHPKLSVLAARAGRKKVDQSAGAAGGWIEEDGRVEAIVLARIKVVKKFSKSSKSCSGLAA